MVLISPSGCGSTTLVTLLAQALRAHVTWIDVSVRRTMADAASSAISEARTGFTSSRQHLQRPGHDAPSRGIVVVDHADALFAGQDSADGGAADAAFQGASLAGADAGGQAATRARFQQWARSRRSFQDAPIIVVVSSDERRSARELADSPGWAKVHMFALSVAQTSNVVRCASRFWFGREPAVSAVERIAQRCAGDARQAVQQLALPPRGASSLAQQLNGNIFQAASFILSDGTSSGFGRRKGAAHTDERLQAWTCNPRVPRFVHALFPKALASSFVASSSVVMPDVSHFAETMSVLDARRRGSALALRSAAETVSGLVHKLHDVMNPRFVPEYDHREMSTHAAVDSTRAFSRAHLLVCSPDHEVAGYWRRSSSELMDYADEHRSILQSRYRTMHAMPSRKLTHDQDRVITDFLQAPAPKPLRF